MLISPFLLQRFVMLSALFMLLPIATIQYIGEESIYAIKTYEMFYQKTYFITTLYGNVWPHGVLFHWVAILISTMIGWEHLDIAIRLVSVVSTWGSATVIAVMAKWLFPNHANAHWIAAAIYLTMGEISFWYGWLGHADALFSFFIFSSIASLWVALEKRNIFFWILALTLINLAFLTKNITAFAFFGLAGVVLAVRLERLDLIKSIPFIFSGIIALTIPLWFQHITQISGSSGNISQTILWDIPRAVFGGGWQGFVKNIVSQPAIFFFRALPISIFITILWLKQDHKFEVDRTSKTIFLVLFACFIPFWFPSGTSPRYLVPLYGLAALLLTSFVLQLNNNMWKRAFSIMLIVLILKLPYSLFILPYVKDWRPNHDIKSVAHEVLAITKDAPLYTRNQVPDGYSIVAYINAWAQKKPIQWYKGQKNVFILTQQPSQLGKLVKTWFLRGDTVYLYWKAKTHD